MLLVGAVTLSALGIAAAAGPTNGVISACYQGNDRDGRDGRNDRNDRDENNGDLRLVDRASDCRRGETFIQWNQSGLRDR